MNKYVQTRPFANPEAAARVISRMKGPDASAPVPPDTLPHGGG
jgi:hypothetical protein